MDKEFNVALVFDNYGPYHIARARSLVPFFRSVDRIQFYAGSKDYGWDAADSKIITMFDRSDGFLIRAVKCYRLVSSKPLDAIFLPGWGDVNSLICLFVCKILGIKCILMSESNYFDRRRSFLLERVKSLIVRFFDGAICGGIASYEYLKLLRFKKPIASPGYNVVDNDFFQSSCSSDVHFIDSLGLAKNEYILCVARFVPKKNHLELLGAIKILLDSRKDGLIETNEPKIVLVGGGQLEYVIRNEIDRLCLSQNILIIDFLQQDQIRALYRNARCSILTSKEEQWGLVINESLSSGCPVIVSSRVGSHIDLVKPELTGWVYELGNLQQLSLLLAVVFSPSFDKTYFEAHCQTHIKNYSLDLFGVSSFSLVKRVFKKEL